MNKEFFRKLHLWLSIPLGLIIVIICLSGAILIFEKDFGHIGQGYVNSKDRTALPMDSILHSAEIYLNGSNSIVGVTTYPEADHAYKVMLAKPAMAALWIDQYTGEVTGKYERAKIFKIASSAHRRLFGKTKSKGSSEASPGKLIIGITTLGFLLIIISGVILWWPKKGMWRKKLTISTKNGTFRFMRDFHCTGGALSALVLILCILTGLNWSFGWYRNAFYGILGSEVSKSSLHKTPANNYQAWENAFKTIKSENEDKEIRLYQGEADVVVGGIGNQQAVNTYLFDSESGIIESSNPYIEKSRSSHIKGWIYTLHVGSWIGWLTKILYLICVIIGATLPITGYYLWIKRIVRKQQPK